MWGRGSTAAVHGEQLPHMFIYRQIAVFHLFDLHVKMWFSIDISNHAKRKWQKMDRFIKSIVLDFIFDIWFECTHLNMPKLIT